VIVCLNSVVNACSVNAFKARFDKFWQHQAVKFDFTVDLTGTKNQSRLECSLGGAFGMHCNNHRDGLYNTLPGRIADKPTR